jgi:hypothetical protein
MCGIFGVVTHERCHQRDWIVNTVQRLFQLSESRGKEAAGIALLTTDAIRIYKEDSCASEMITRSEYRRLFDESLGDGLNGNGQGPRRPLAIIGHSRLVTTGDLNVHDNNQPVINEDIVGIHNGIVVNHEALWERFPAMTRHAEVDTEVILGLTRHFLKEGRSLIESVTNTFSLIQGAASVALLFGELNQVVLATNNGSLYVVHSEDGNTLLFASERHILETLIADRTVRHITGNSLVRHIRATEACIVDLTSIKPVFFSLTSLPSGLSSPEQTIPLRKLIELRPVAGQANGKARRGSLATGLDARPLCGTDSPPAHLRRCTRCILPETMPLIEFDARGVCNYCDRYQKVACRGVDALERELAPHRRHDGEPDCLVGVSGGRDSCYGLHYIKAVLKMNPIAYTYDWGMVTDLARRNISRMCGKLGIEHLLVSADIPKKREYIRQNVEAWLKRPDLGLVPLFMAGDKQFFYHMKRLRKQTGIEFMLFCAGNEMEQTFFKTGFCGVGGRKGGILKNLPIFDRIKLAAYYAKGVILNPAYLNGSLLDTLFAYYCSYMMPDEYVYLYHYLPWDEMEVMDTLRRDYDWEYADDTVATWRIGDGTASFYNYIYHTVAGFTENDTFRSNQIREGKLTRDRALEIVAQENRPRWKSIRWYCDIIGVDFEHAISTINRIPKLRAAASA